MKINYKLYCLALALLAVVTSCRDGQEENLPEQGKAQPIEIRAFLKEGTKITPLSELHKTRIVGGNLAEGFHIYGIAGTTKWTSGIPAGDYIWNDAAVSPDGTIEGGTKVWLSDGATYHHFGGYGTFTVSGNEVGWQGALLADGSREFRQSPIPDASVDVLVAEPVMNVVASSSAPVVNLYFKHALSRVVIKLYGSGATPLYDVKATATKTDMVIRSRCYVPIFGTASSEPDFKWTTGTTTLNKEPLTLAAVNKDKANAILLGDLIVPPTTLAYPEDWLTISLDYDMGGGFTQSVTTGLPSTTGMLAGMQYTYYINHVVNTEALTVSQVEVTDWVTDEYVVDELK